MYFRPRMVIFKRLLFIIISFSLGFIFIYSAYAKLYPVIETFEFTFVDLGIGDWYTAPILARLIIGMEFFAGILLIANYQLKKFTLPLTFAILGFFIIYLCIQLVTTGNSGNCGCFGEHFKMTPLQALIKNLVMIVAALWVYINWQGWKTGYSRLLLSLFASTAMVLPFLINPIDYAYTSNNLEEKVNYPLELALLFQPEDSSKVQIPGVELRSGKHVVAFLSLTCQHCRVAAKKFRIIKKKNRALPIYFVLNGDRAMYKSFIEETGADNIPFSFCLGKSFVQLASTQLPRIYYLDNSLVVKKVDYFELNQYAIENWLKTGKP